MDDMAGEVASGLALNYDTYYGSGYYDARYPRANLRTLSVLRRVLHRAGPGGVVDFGCGNGRYMVPMLAMCQASRAVTGIDISARSLQDLRGRLRAGGADFLPRLIHGDGHALDHLHNDGPQALAMMMFGVLSHIQGRAEREAVLQRLKDLLEPTNGRLVLSVPNRLRRFRKLQGDDADITYRRKRDDRELSFFYHLYDPDSLRRDLNEAGLAIESMVAESVLPESWITNNRVLGWLDALISPLIPARLGYGLLVVARPKLTESFEQ